MLGAVFTYFAVEVLRTESPKVAMRMFTFSITYLTVLFAVMALDVVVRYGCDSDPPPSPDRVAAAGFSADRHVVCRVPVRPLFRRRQPDRHRV